MRHALVCMTAYCLLAGIGLCGGGEILSALGPFFLARCCLGQVPGGAPFSQRSEQATACTNRMQIRN